MVTELVPRVFPEARVLCKQSLAVEVTGIAEELPKLLVYLKDDLSSMDHPSRLMSLAGMQLQALLEDVEKDFPSCGSSIPVVVLLPKSSMNYSVNMLAAGMGHIVTIFACAHIYTKVDVVAVQYDIDCIPNEQLANVAKFLQETPRVAAILHGGTLTLSAPKVKPPFTSPLPPGRVYSLVTGGARGIGEHISRELAKQGRNVIVTGRPGGDVGPNFASQLRSTYSVDAIFLPLNLSDHSSIDQFAEMLHERGIILDVVVHNAAVGTKTAAYQTTDTHNLSDVLVHVNTVGPVTLQNALMSKPDLVRSACDGGCTVVAISSVGALRAFAEMHPIDQASKTVVDEWARQLERDHAHLRVVTIAPGATDTDMFQQSVLNALKKSGKLNAFISKLPKHMIIQPSDLGVIAAFLCREDLAPNVHGSNVAACCGMHLDYNSLPNVEDDDDVAVSADAAAPDAQKAAKAVVPAVAIPSPVEIHFQCEANLYHSVQNPKGNVNFGSAVNCAVPQYVLPFLPSFLTARDATYQIPAGSQAFREWLAGQGGVYTAQQTVTSNTLFSMLSLIAADWKHVAVTGIPLPQLSFLASHSGCTFRGAHDFAAGDARAHWIFVEDVLEGARGVSLQDALRHCEQLQAGSVCTVIVLSRDQMRAFQSLPLHSLPLGFVFTQRWLQNMSCGVLQTAALRLLTPAQAGAYFYPLSSPLQAAAVNHTPLPAGSYDRLVGCLLTMLEQSQGIHDLPREQFFFATGATAILETLGRVLFQPGDVLGIDAPYYYGFHDDFGRSGVSLLPVHYDQGDVYVDAHGQTTTLGSTRVQRLPSTLRSRAERAYADGAAGFIVCNPHNPTGRVYPAHEVHELCAWALSLNQAMESIPESPSHRLFHIIFDELYAHSIYDAPPASFASAIPYTRLTRSIHVVRGFAKDFGLCGFKVGYGISSHAGLHARAKEWESILRPSEVMAGVMADMLENTQYGRLVFERNQALLKRRCALARDALTQQCIPYLFPKSGVYFMIDLHAELEANPLLTETSITLRLFQEHGVNITQGCKLGAKPGWFRLCHVTAEEDAMHQGIERLGQFVREVLRPSTST